MMEQSSLATEENSNDSIPGPSYERIIDTPTGKRTNIIPTDAAVSKSRNGIAMEMNELDDDVEEDVECSDGNEEEDMYIEYEQGDDGNVEHNSKEEDENHSKNIAFKDYERRMEEGGQRALPLNAERRASGSISTPNLLNTTKASKEAILVEPSKVTATTTVDGVNVRSGSGTCPVPVQIVSAISVKPKMMSVKTKNNKLVMVQLVNEQQKASVSNQSCMGLTADSTASDSSTVEKEASDNGAQQESQEQEQQPSREQQSQREQQQQITRYLSRSSTPLAREFLALQRSVNESKVLSEFVTDTVRKRQKGAPKDVSDQSSSMQQHLSLNVEKPRKSGKFAPLKDDGASSLNTNSLVRRSRSKSVNRKSIDVLDASSSAAATTSTSGNKLKRWPSDEKMLLKRTNMRSQNSEFVQKQMEFLNRVKHDEGDASSEADDGERNYVNGGEEFDANLVAEHNTMNDSNASAMGIGGGSTSSLLEAPLDREINASGGGSGGSGVDCIEERLMAYWVPSPKRGWDSFCWKCRECADLFPCSKCARSFHCTCIKVTASTKLDDTWICPECINVENVLNGPKRSRRSEMPLDLLSQLLSFALKRMKMVKGYSKFLYTEEDLFHYSKYIVNPVTFSILQDKIEKRTFRCPEEFLNETKWILHNAIILSNSTNSKEVFTAKSILKVCRQETNEIETCGECYLNANTRNDWFVDVCSQPHLLLWAKLKGFPYWPAKAMGPGQGLSHVNVRFFGEHDRAYVPVKDCFLYCEQDPNTQTGKRSARELADCIKEVEVHIEKIKSKVGAFKYAKFKTPYEPADELQQLEMMMPGVTEYMKKQQALTPKPSLQYKIVKTADNHLSIIKKASTTESGNDSDYSGSPGKRTSCGSGGSAITVSDAKPSLIGTKYEVVTKASSDDSNSSKVTAVILKRKASNEHRKDVGGGEELELPLPKMMKFDQEDLGADHSFLQVANKNSLVNMPNTTPTGAGNVTMTSKRKQGSDPGGGGGVIGGLNTIQGSGNSEIERPSTKHAKHEPRVPIITIKTNAKELQPPSLDKKTSACAAANDDITKHPTEGNINTPTATTTDVTMKMMTPVVKEEYISLAMPAPTIGQLSNNNAQTMMENLVKNKHGVTIKKLSKDDVKKTAAEETTRPTGTSPAKAETHGVNANAQTGGKKADATANGALTNSTPPTNKSKNGKTSTEDGAKSTNKRDENTKDTTGKSTVSTAHILKDLVPFVEIKKEVTSDDEGADMAAAIGEQVPKTVTASEKANPTVTTVSNAAIAMPVPKQPDTITQMPAPLPASTSPMLQPNLAIVKKEVTSDEEELSADGGGSAADSLLTPAAVQPTINISSSLAAEKPSDPHTTIAPLQSNISDAVRVGDTMIQRVNIKNIRSVQPSLVALKSPAQLGQEAAAALDAATAAVAAMHSSPPNRRPNTRGVPYGPLPASAVAPTQTQAQSQKGVTATGIAATVNRTGAQQQQQQQQQQPQTSPPQIMTLHAPQQRARKSFPNRGTPEINSPARTNFVSATQTSQPSLPPPPTSPMTANNDMKRTLSKNSMVSIPRQAWSPHESQRSVNNAGHGSSNSTNSSVSNASTHSIPVPPLTAVSKTPTIVATLSENNTTGIGNGSAPINSTSISTPFVTCNGGVGTTLLAPLTMCAPPPLAGLSQPSINMLTPTSAVSIAAGIPAIVASNSTSNCKSTVSSSITISSANELSTQPQPLLTTTSNISGGSGMASVSSSLSNPNPNLNNDFVTPGLTAMVTDAICRGPPKMIQRPNGPLQSDGATMFPSQAGPVCQTLVENAHKLTDFFISVMEDTMVEMSVGEEPVLQAKITLLKMELERTKQAYEQEIAELKRTSDLIISEMRKSMENEKTRIANEIRKQCEQERLRSIDETKKKQWCSNCGREAQFYCCWNTSYCDYPCQQMHWSRHSATCAQARPTTGGNSDSLAKSAGTITSSISTMTAQGPQQQKQQQQQSHILGVGKASMAVTQTTANSITPGQQQQQTTHYNNKNTMANNKKDKHSSSKISHQHSGSSSIIGGGGGVGGVNMSTNSMAAGGTVSASGATTELLKLPSNTYLRTVPQCGGNTSASNNNSNSSGGGSGGSNIRGSTYAVQRVNIPLPITALVQRGNSWELTSAAPNSNAGTTISGSSGTNVQPTLTQLTSQQQQQQQQQRIISGGGGTGGSSMMPRVNSRNRAAAQAVNTRHGPASSVTNTGGAPSAAMPCSVMRSTQM